MTQLRQAGLYTGMRHCVAAAGKAGVAGVLRAVIEQMRQARGLSTAARVPSILDKSAAADVDLSAAREAVRGLGEDLPGFSELLRSDDCLGQVYQAINEPALAAAYRATARGGRKFDESEIPAVTQLFTPSWVVQFLLQNTLGRAWLEMHPDSGLELPWLAVRPPKCKHSVKLARELKLLDPACGTQNFGLAAYDLLAAMYREEIARAGESGWGAEPSVASENDIAAAILRHNLFGIDIDPIVLELARVDGDEIRHAGR